jgi:plastocyanin
VKSIPSLILSATIFVSMFLGEQEAFSFEKRPLHTIVIEGMKFIPESLEASSGDTVVWVNKDFFPHTATASDKRFDSREIKANASWKYVLKKKGLIAYSCTLHPTMKGAITVK